MNNRVETVGWILLKPLMLLDHLFQTHRGLEAKTVNIKKELNGD